MALSRYLLNELLDDVSIPFDRDLVIGSLPRKHLSLASLKPNYLRRLIEDSSEKNLSVRDQENRFKVIYIYLSIFAIGSFVLVI